jgi:hypothetical protein
MPARLNSSLPVGRIHPANTALPPRHEARAALVCLLFAQRSTRWEPSRPARQRSAYGAGRSVLDLLWPSPSDRSQS